jgi:hypothetical protein
MGNWAVLFTQCSSRTCGICLSYLAEYLVLANSSYLVPIFDISSVFVDLFGTFHYICAYLVTFRKFGQCSHHICRAYLVIHYEIIKHIFCQLIGCISSHLCIFCHISSDFYHI